jgi:uncharacterized low-complexity protein
MTADHRKRTRDDAGQTTAEYVGIVAAAALLAVALASVSVTIATNAEATVQCAYAKIGAALSSGDGSCGESEDGEPGNDDPGDNPGDNPGDDPPSDEPTEEPTEEPEERGEALPQVCFDPGSYSSNSNVVIPGGSPMTTAAAQTYTWLYELIANAINNEDNKEEWVKEALAEMHRCMPDYNIVISQLHDGNTQEMDGAALVQTIEIGGSTFRVYAFKTGTFTWDEDADLGWKNRGFYGNFEVSEDRRTVTFGEPPKPKRKEGWEPGDPGCQVEGVEPPDRSNYYNTYTPLDNEGSAAQVQSLVSEMRRCYPDYNVMAMHSEQGGHWADEPDTMVYQDRYRLNSPEYYDDEQGSDIESGRAVFDVYVFDNGTFNNDGDGGYTNWNFYGDFERDGSEVTFEPPPPADLEADPPFGSDPVNFNDETPKYTEGTYPGTDFDGGIPGDDSERTHSLIDEYSKAFPDTNIIAVKDHNDIQFTGLSGVEHLAVVDGVNIFSIDSGAVTNTGDGGWNNWGFTGQYEYDEEEMIVAFN